MPPPPRPPYTPVGFSQAKALAITALVDTGDILHEPRDAQAEKNLLAVGDVTAAFVADLIRSCNGRQYRSSPHHDDPCTEVHEFFPAQGRAGRRPWYVKLYFRRSTVFISVHQ